MKIVLDTTILVRANEHTKGLLSNEMLHELAKVLRYPRLQMFYDLSENLVFDYVDFLRRSSEIVILDPLVITPIRDANDIIVTQTAIIGEANILCTKDEDFFESPANEYLNKLDIEVLDDVDLMHRLRM